MLFAYRVPIAIGMVFAYYPVLLAVEEIRLFIQPLLLIKKSSFFSTFNDADRVIIKFAGPGTL